MSVLNNKHILIVGEETDKIRTLRSFLNSHGMSVFSVSCKDEISNIVKDNRIDLAIINDLNDEVTCTDTLLSLHKIKEGNQIPVLIFIKDIPERIQEVLSQGAADYLTEEESTESIIQKISAVFSESDQFSGNSAIDITPTEVSITSTGIRVYVVEDDPLLRNLLSIRMEKSSFPCEFSVDGQDALQAMRQFKPDIIILDLMLPGKSGFEILQELKDDHSLGEVPVVVFSNKDSQEDRKMAKNLGASAFYVKAMTDLSDLIEKIESLVK